MHSGANLRLGENAWSRVIGGWAKGVSAEGITFSQKRKLHDSDCKYLSSGHSSTMISIQTGGQ